jgi:hypothetical protein
MIHSLIWTLFLLCKPSICTYTMHVDRIFNGASLSSELMLGQPVIGYQDGAKMNVYECSAHHPE